MRANVVLLALGILVLVGCTDSQPSNGAPVANAGQDRVVAVGDPVTLDGRRSVDPDGDALNYSWRLVTTPEGSNANFTEAGNQTATLVTDAKGTYVIELMVTDGEAQSADRVTVEAREELVFEPGTPEEYDPYRTGELIEAEVVLPGATQSTWIGYSVIDGLAIFQGDIILGRVDPDSGTLATQSTVIDDRSFLWPGGTVYYEIDNSIRLNPVRRYVFDLMENIDRAIAHWEARTDLEFVPRDGQADYIVFTSGSGCSSYVGMQGGKQDIALSIRCDSGIIAHEIGHAVGLYHEHTHPDRKSFIRIHEDNIDPDPAVRSNFDIPGDALGSREYDYGSIMHYGPNAFSINGLPTIETIPPGIPIGQRTALSQGDIDAVDNLYRKTAEFGGIVTDAATELPIADASVTWGAATTATRSDGTYSLSVPCDTRTITVSKDGYETASETYTPVCLSSSVKDVVLAPADEVDPDPEPGIPGTFTLHTTQAYCTTSLDPAIGLHWNESSGAQTYEVWRNGVLYYEMETLTPHFDNTENVTAGEAYSYFIRARNEAGFADSNTRSVTAPSTCDGPPPAPVVTVSVAPTTATLEPNASRSFTANVAGATNTSVSWSATCGGIAGTGNTITYTAPSSAGSCALTARSVADASKSASATVTVTGGEPTAGADLVVFEGIVLDPTPMRAGELSTVRFIVRNQGDGTAAASTAFLGVNRSTSGPPVYERGEWFEIPSLAAGAVYEVATSATLPDGFWSGTYVLWAVVDIHSTAGQSNESNDATYEVFVIEGQGNPCQHQDVEVTFPDADLEGAVRAELSQPTGPITCWGMYGLGMLGPLDDLDIASLEGLQYAGTLDTLWIGGGGRDLDLSPLADLPLLYFLDVVASGVDDLAPLANLDSLRLLTLNLSDTGDLTPLSGLRLTDFSMNESGIANLWPLAGMVSLSRLQLNQNQIGDLAPLEGLSNLTELYLGGNQIRNVTAISGMTELTGLYLSGNQISDISPLTDLTKLTQLMLYDNQISELDPLVDNVGLGAGDEVNLRGNCLDLRTGSPDMAAIDVLVSRGVDVSYYPQAECGNNGDDPGPSPTPAGEHITNGDFSSGATGWLIGPDFWIGEGERYRSPPNYAAGGVDADGFPISNALGLMQQTVAIPSGVSQAWFGFWYYISSDDSRPGRDTLSVLVAGPSCEILAGTFDNLDSTDGAYRQHVIDVSDCIGETVEVSFVAATDDLLDTVFRIDDVSLMSFD